VIKNIDFADYGLPTGACGDFQRGFCGAGPTETEVETDCLGENSCDVQARNSGFTDPCYGHFKRLAVQVECGAP
jgi:hypothetical protein